MLGAGVAQAVGVESCGVEPGAFGSFANDAAQRFGVQVLSAAIDAGRQKILAGYVLPVVEYRSARGAAMYGHGSELAALADDAYRPVDRVDAVASDRRSLIDAQRAVIHECKNAGVARRQHCGAQGIDFERFNARRLGLIGHADFSYQPARVLKAVKRGHVGVKRADRRKFEASGRRFAGNLTDKRSNIGGLCGVEGFPRELEVCGVRVKGDFVGANCMRRTAQGREVFHVTMSKAGVLIVHRIVLSDESEIAEEDLRPGRRIYSMQRHSKACHQWNSDEGFFPSKRGVLDNRDFAGAGKVHHSTGNTVTARTFARPGRFEWRIHRHQWKEKKMPPTKGSVAHRPDTRLRARFASVEAQIEETAGVLADTQVELLKKAGRLGESGMTLAQRAQSVNALNSLRLARVHTGAALRSIRELAGVDA